MTADITGISNIKRDEEGNLFIQFNQELLKQMGWDSHTLLEWEIIGNMAIVRKVDND